MTNSENLRIDFFKKSSSKGVLRVGQTNATLVHDLWNLSFVLKMQHKEFIILRLEDYSDWTNSTTRFNDEFTTSFQDL